MLKYEEIKPKKDKIDFDRFEQLCICQCSREDIANDFNIDTKYLEEIIKEKYGYTFSVIYNQLKGKGLNSLRHKMFSNAMKGGKGQGDTIMQIFLAKNWLNMSDKVEASVDEKVEIINDIKED